MILNDVTFNYVKVKHPSKKKPVYLEQAKLITKGDYIFISGYEIGKDCEPKIVKGGGVLHLLQVGKASS